MTFAAHIAGRALAIRPESLSALTNLDRVTPDASRFVGAPAGGGLYRMIGSTAVLSIVGALFARGSSFSEMWGFQTYETLDAKLRAAAADSKVRSIVLDLDSPGGDAVGAFELAGLVRQIGASKPIVASVNGLACSAAYAIASGCKTIIATPSSVIGSVGVVALHADYSRALDQAGVTPSLVFAGRHKTDGNPYQPLGEGARADLQSEVDRFYSMFLDTVAAGRAGRLTRDAARQTEARTFIGRDAQAAGLVDRIGTFHFALACAGAFASPTTTSAGHSAAKGSSMNSTSPKPGAEAWDETVSALNRQRAKTTNPTGRTPPAAAPPRRASADPDAAAFAAVADETPKQTGSAPWAQIAAELNRRSRG